MNALYYDDRSWWQKRTNWGMIFIGLSIILTLANMSAELSKQLHDFGELIAFYGVGHRMTKRG
jgi:hypothetical protein